MRTDISSTDTTATRVSPPATCITIGTAATPLPSNLKPMGAKFIWQLPIIVSNSNDCLGVMRMIPDQHFPRDDPLATFDLSNAVMNSSTFQLTSSYVSQHEGEYKVKILQTLTPPLNLQHKDMHRFAKGAPKYALQITSDATLRGHIAIAPVSRVRRKYFEYRPVGSGNPVPYEGYELLDMDLNLSHALQNGHTIVDLSTDRVVYIQAPEIPQNPNYDLDWQRSMYESPQPGSVSDLNASSEFYLDNILVITPWSDIVTTGSNAGTITIEAFADYSDVEYELEMLPMFSYYTESQRNAYVDLVKGYANGKKKSRLGQPLGEGGPAKVEDHNSLSLSPLEISPNVNTQSVPDGSKEPREEYENAHTPPGTKKKRTGPKTTTQPPQGNDNVYGQTRVQPNQTVNQY